MPIFSEWRDLGVPVLYTYYPDLIDPDDFMLHPQQVLAMIEGGPGPFIRLLDIRQAQFPLGTMPRMLEVLGQPAFRHPWRRFLAMVADASLPGTSMVRIMLRSTPASQAFLTLAEAEDFIRREGPGLIERGIPPSDR